MSMFKFIYQFVLYSFTNLFIYLLLHLFMFYLFNYLFILYGWNDTLTILPVKKYVDVDVKVGSFLNC